ncbi:hypothetical protein [Dethiobacter alkaliphilus]|uniref:hypothetical protein n=1 Tax=Dethiobacter alkaliphilus TaxID=427926 RepID=UPI0022272E3F|nr:hypothetical protein [Dethiobacter alkaliphilus]MCW3490860.1 hypothetical protein [Dethiobacter alkaliphilus]
MDRKSFILGFVSSAIIFIVILAGLTAMASARGVTVRLDSEDLAAMVRDRIVAQAKAEMPAIINSAKAEIPAIVEQEMENEFKSDRMEIAGFVFQMPDELMQQLRSNMRRNVEQATGKILDGIETEELAHKFGEDAYAMVLSTMEEEISGQSFQVMLFDLIPMRVRILIQ